MKTMEANLWKEMNELNKMVEEAEKRLKAAPKGLVRIKKKRGKAEYYYKDENSGGGNGRYLRKNERDIAKGIVQRDYDACVVKIAKERIRAIKTFLKMYTGANLSTIYQKLSPYRRNLINNLILPDDEYVRRWEAVQYVGKPHPEGAP